MINKLSKYAVSPKFLRGIIWLLFITNIFSFGIYFYNTQSLDYQEFSFTDPSRRFVHQDDLIVNIQPLREHLHKKYGSDPHVAMYFEYLPTGANISINKDAQFYPASLLKVPVATAIAKKISQGDWNWNNELVLLSGDRDELFGSLYQEPTNSTHTIIDLIRRSLIESDNTAHFILLRNLETEEVEDVYEHIGLKDFFDTDGRLTVKQYSATFRMLYTSSYLEPEFSEKILSVMTESAFSDFIEGGLPDTIKFSHKIGIAVDKGVFVDSGIVYVPNRPYILTVMVQTDDEKKAKNIMQDISRSVYNYISTYAEIDN